MKKICIIIIENEKPLCGCRGKDKPFHRQKQNGLFFIAYVVNTR